MEFSQLPELPAKFLDDNFSIDKVFVGEFAEGFPPGGFFDEFSLVIFHGQHVDFGLHFSFGQSLHSIGGVDQDSIVLIGADKGKGSVFGVVVDCVLVVGVGFCEGGDSGDITLAHVLEGEGVEVGGIVVHF